MEDAMPPLEPEENEEKKKKKDKKYPGKKELAMERTILSQERTLSAWVRTDASFITFGFAIYKLLETRMQEQGRTPLFGFLGPREFAIIMFLSGFIGLLLALFKHYRSLALMRKFGKKHFSISAIQAYVMLALSLLMIYGAVFRQ